MTVIRPPITGDAVLDSWTNQITQALNSGIIGAVGATGQATTGASGFNTATIYLFARTTTNSAPAKPNETTVYTYDTGVLLGSSSNNNGETSSGLGTGSEANTWFRSVPASSNGDYSWITTVNVADLDPVETILSSSWTTVSALAAPGLSNRVDIAYFTVLDGSSGTNSFPTGTVAGGNYTKATKGSRNFEGIRTVSWEGIEPAPSTTIGDYVITQLTGNPGAGGAGGTNNATVAIYQKNTSDSAPSGSNAAPTGVYRYTFGNSTPLVQTSGNANGWGVTIPSLVNGENLWMKTATASTIESYDDINVSEFSSAIRTTAAGLDGNSVAVVELYQVSTSSSSAPTDPTGTFLYTFSSNLLTIDSGTDASANFVLGNNLSQQFLQDNTCG